MGSTCTRRRCRLSRVGRKFEHALYMNVRTFGGTFKVHILFQTDPWARAAECSTLDWFFNRKATWWAVLTENCSPWFSFHAKVSWELGLLSGIAKISTWVRWAMVAKIFPRSHCLVSWSISSQTRISLETSFRGTGEWDNQPQVWTPQSLAHHQPSSVSRLDRGAGGNGPFFFFYFILFYFILFYFIILFYIYIYIYILILVILFYKITLCPL